MQTPAKIAELPWFWYLMPVPEKSCDYWRNRGGASNQTVPLAEVLNNSADYPSSGAEDRSPSVSAFGELGVEADDFFRANGPAPQLRPKRQNVIDFDGGPARFHSFCRPIPSRDEAGFACKCFMSWE